MGFSRKNPYPLLRISDIQGSRYKKYRRISRGIDDSKRDILNRGYGFFSGKAQSIITRFALKCYTYFRETSRWAEFIDIVPVVILFAIQGTESRAIGGRRRNMKPTVLEQRDSRLHVLRLERVEFVIVGHDGRRRRGSSRRGGAVVGAVATWDGRDLFHALFLVTLHSELQIGGRYFFHFENKLQKMWCNVMGYSIF